MTRPNELTIRLFQPEDQTAVKSLVLDGLKDRWNKLDPFKNTDLDDIAASYAGGCFRVAVWGGRIVGTGALIPFAEDTAEIRRMSVDRSFRRRGIGSAILRRLREDAKSAGCRKIILETTATWKDAVAFHQKHGFRMTHRQGEDQFFVLELNPPSVSVV